MEQGRLSVGQIQVELHVGRISGGSRPLFDRVDERSAVSFEPLFDHRRRTRQLSTADVLEYDQLVREIFAAAHRAGLAIFHKERNGWGTCNGFLCVEFSLVHVSTQACESFVAMHCPGVRSSMVCQERIL